MWVGEDEQAARPNGTHLSEPVSTWTPSSEGLGIFSYLFFHNTSRSRPQKDPTWCNYTLLVRSRYKHITFNFSRICWSQMS